MIQEESMKQSALLWAEKDKIKRLQDNFVEVNCTVPMPLSFCPVKI